MITLTTLRLNKEELTYYIDPKVNTYLDKLSHMPISILDKYVIFSVIAGYDFQLKRLKRAYETN